MAFAYPAAAAPGAPFNFGNAGIVPPPPGGAVAGAYAGANVDVGIKIRSNVYYSGDYAEFCHLNGYGETEASAAAWAFATAASKFYSLGQALPPAAATAGVAGMAGYPGGAPATFLRKKPNAQMFYSCGTRDLTEVKATLRRLLAMGAVIDPAFIAIAAMPGAPAPNAALAVAPAGIAAPPAIIAQIQGVGAGGAAIPMPGVVPGRIIGLTNTPAGAVEPIPAALAAVPAAVVDALAPFQQGCIDNPVRYCEAVIGNELRDAFTSAISYVLGAKFWAAGLILCQQVKPLKVKHVKSFFLERKNSVAPASSILSITRAAAFACPSVVNDPVSIAALPASRFITYHSSYSSAGVIMKEVVAYLGVWAPIVFSAPSLALMDAAYQAQSSMAASIAIPSRALVIGRAYASALKKDFGDWYQGERAQSECPASFYNTYKALFLRMEELSSVAVHMPGATSIGVAFAVVPAAFKQI